MSIEFAIEWAYGEFRIARLRGTDVVKSWKSPTPVRDLADLQHALAEAAGAVDLGRGGSVAIAYEDDLHTHEFLEIPAMSRRDRARFLERHVETNKPFDAKAAWRAHPVRRNKTNGVLLHLMPSYVIDALMRVCGDYYLVPKILVPLTEIMSRHVPSLDIKDQSRLLLIALFDDRTQMLVSNEAGEILFVRELSYPWTPETNGRLVVDINRTIGYSKQRLGGSVAQAQVLGVNAEAVSTALDSRIDAKVAFERQAAEPEFWMRQVAALPQSLHSNFIPLLARSSITSKTLMRAGLLMTSVLILATIGIVGAVEYAVRKDRTDVDAMQRKISDRLSEISVLESDIASMQTEARKLDLLNLDAFNLPGLFMSRLADIIPPGLVVTDVEIEKTRTGWDLSIKGESRTTLGEVAPLLAALESHLTAPPWNAGITTSWETAWMAQLEQGLAANADVVGFEVRGELK